MACCGDFRTLEIKHTNGYTPEAAGVGEWGFDTFALVCMVVLSSCTATCFGGYGCPGTLTCAAAPPLQSHALPPLPQSHETQVLSLQITQPHSPNPCFLLLRGMAAEGFVLPGGVYTALVTPFTPDGNAVDHAALKALVEVQVAAGVAGVVPVRAEMQANFRAPPHHAGAPLLRYSAAPRGSPPP